MFRLNLGDDGLLKMAADVVGQCKLSLPPAIFEETAFGTKIGCENFFVLWRFSCVKMVANGLFSS